MKFESEQADGGTDKNRALAKVCQNEERHSREQEMVDNISLNRSQLKPGDLAFHQCGSMARNMNGHMANSLRVSGHGCLFFGLRVAGGQDAGD